MNKLAETAKLPAGIAQVNFPAGSFGYVHNF